MILIWKWPEISDHYFPHLKREIHNDFLQISDFFKKLLVKKNITKGISMESVFSKFFKNFICDSDPCIQKIEWSDDRVIWDHDLIGDHFFVMLQIVILIWSKMTF